MQQEHQMSVKFLLARQYGGALVRGFGPFRRAFIPFCRALVAIGRALLEELRARYFVRSRGERP
jgi:hypothetical protein